MHHFKTFLTVLLTLAGTHLSPAQSIKDTFNSPGALGSALLLWNNNNGKSAYTESASGGVGAPASGAIAVAGLAPGNADSTAVDQTAFNFATAPVGTYYVQSIDFLLTSPASGTAQRVVQLGFLNDNNSGFLGTAEANPAQAAPSFISLRISSTSTANPSSYNIQSQNKLSTDSGATTSNSSANFSLSAGQWYRFSVFTTNHGSGSFSLSGLVESLGANGVSAPTSVFIYSPITLTNPELATQANIFSAFRSTSGTGLGFLDEFSSVAFPSSGPGISPPQFIPPDSSTYAGTPVTASVTASGTGPLHYRWLESYNGSPFTEVAGANASQLPLANPSLAAGDYRYQVIVTNSGGAATSAPSAVLNVFAASAPFSSLAATPQTMTSFLGGSACFCAAFEGTQPISYQWKFSTDQAHYKNIPGATNASLLMKNLTMSDAGCYSLWAANALSAGQEVNSGNARLTVLSQALPAMLSLTNANGLSVSVFSDGNYTITARNPNWNFAGSVGSGLFSLGTNAGRDGVGDYSEISFGYLINTASRLASIRLYAKEPVVLFSTTCLSDTINDLAFPCLTTYPANLSHVGFSGNFGIYSFTKFDAESPWLFYDTNFNSFILSPATNYMIASDVKTSSSLACGIHSAIPQLPAGFTHRAVLVIQNGINRTFDTWGGALTSLSGKIRPANDAAIELKKLGYWTDNFMTYYYSYVSSYGYAGTLLAVRDEFARLGVPLGYLQLDSWWYPKGAANSWQGDAINSRGGYDQYIAEPSLFPEGLSAFQKQLDLPLVTHCRWIDPASPYVSRYAMSANVSVDPAFWTHLMAYIGNAGVVTFEQDWLNIKALPLMNLKDPPAFMSYMQAAAASKNLNMQYCMPLPRHYLQGSLYNNLVTMRVSNDGFEIGKWDEFLYDSRLVTALGAWPWTDGYFSSQTRNVLISTLSAGPVGVGDALGSINVPNLQKAVRQDSVIVKPDKSLLPTDQSYLNDARGLNLPMVAAAYSDHNGLLDAYVFTYARSASKTNASFSPGLLGVAGDTYVYDYFKQTGSVVRAGNAYGFSTTVKGNSAGGSYFVVVPIGPSGIGFLGDTNKFATLGRQRISALSDSGILWATVVFAQGETNLTLSGYAPSLPCASVDGLAAAVSYDAINHYFSVKVSSNNTGSAMLALSLAPLPAISALPPLQATVEGSQLKISWPPALAGCVIERANSLTPPADWIPVSNACRTTIRIQH